jgi:alanyl-tRNA synthetase
MFEVPMFQKMKSADIRQSFLDFFAAKQHTIVPSASIMPSSPNLLFTNAGMNQFVPYFLGEREAPYARAADTQKCIRAGGKHNDLEDVGFDTYHHTFFEMLGNWSFGDYFKKEAIEWGWELLTKVWGFPANRLYATVYQPGEGDPAEFDQEAYDFWKAIFEAEGLDPTVHIVNGNKKDNFWMMGETGPCGPCSEIHIDLTLDGDTKGALVNADSPWCIEIWNLVFIQFNANEDGTFPNLSACHVDTGMGLERVAGIMATTKNFTDFSNPPSNYNSNLFEPIFDHLSKHCDHTYGYTMPEDRNGMTELEQKDCAFRVLADHVRTLSFSIADGILPGNEGRNYVLRRILRRAVMFGKRLNLLEGFLSKLVPVVVRMMSDHFPELYKQETVIIKVIASEETSFNKTIDRGLQLFEKLATNGAITGREAFTLYDTYGFPLDLTELLGRERKLVIDTAGFETCMEEQRQRGRTSQKKQVIRAQDATEDEPTEFVGFDEANLTDCEVILKQVQVDEDGSVWAIFDKTPFYPEMGGQVGDLGIIEGPKMSFLVTDTQKDAAGQIIHRLELNNEVAKSNFDLTSLPKDLAVKASVYLERRRAIQRHHSATHIVNWALREVLGNHIRQAGSLVTKERLRFDFAHYEALSSEQLVEIEQMANTAVIANSRVKAYETPYDQKPDDVVAVFGEKYGAVVRVVDIGGFAKELCGGTHVQSTGEVGLIKIVSESSIATGTRRIEAVCGATAANLMHRTYDQLHGLANQLKCKPEDIGEKLEALIVQRKEVEKELKRLQQKAAATQVGELAAKATDLAEGLKVLIAVADAPNPNELKNIATALGQKLGESVVVLATEFGDKVSIVTVSSSKAIEQGYKAGDIVRDLTSKLGGKGGGKPNFAMGGAPKKEGALASVVNNYTLSLE